MNSIASLILLMVLTCMQIVVCSMGLLSSEQVPLMGSPAHSLAEHLLTMLSYKAGERDMVILHDIIDIEWPNNTKVKITQRIITVVLE